MGFIIILPEIRDEGRAATHVSKAAFLFYYEQMHTHSRVTSKLHMRRCGPMKEQLVTTARRKEKQVKRKKKASVPTRGDTESPGTVRYTCQTISRNC